MAPSDTVSPEVQWDLAIDAAGAATLVLRGTLDTITTPVAWAALDQELRGKPISRLEVDAGKLVSCDSAGLALLYGLSSGSMTPGATTRVIGLGPELQHLLRAFSTEDYQALQAHDPIHPTFVEEVGKATGHWLQDLRQQAEFIGEVSVDLVTSFFYPRRMRWREVFRVFETAGVNALPIVTLLTFLVGMVIAFEAAQSLEQLGAQVFVANLLALTMIRELGPVMASIMLAGRSGSAFAAELGTMKVNEELNALKTMGLSPIQFLIVQRVLAGLMLTPVLTVFAMFAGILGGIPVLLGLGFPLRMIFDQMQGDLHYSDLAQGMFKSVVFGGIVASVSCLRGLQTGEGPRAVGDSTTRSVVSSILLIVLTDAIFAAVTYALK